MIGNNGEVRISNRNTLGCLIFHVLDRKPPITNYCSVNSRQRIWRPPFKTYGVF